jgi:uncharacterized membrane protein HdeD (DUF308 family)
LRLLWKGLVQIIKTLENQRQKHEWSGLSLEAV